MPLCPTSTIEEIEAAYLANLGFEDGGGPPMAINLIQAADYWLLKSPSSASGTDGRSVTLNVDAVQAKAKRARLYLNRQGLVGKGIKVFGVDETFRYPQGY